MERQVNQENSPGTMDSIVDLLASVRRKGVILWSANGQLRFKGPKSSLTQEEIETLRSSKTHIVALLERTNAATEPKLEVHQRLSRAPLALSQLGRWRLCQLHERKTVRQVADAIRLHGRLNINVFRRSVAELIRRHDALRTRILVCDDVPIQQVTKVADFDLEVTDLTALQDRLRELEVQRSIEQLILEPINVAVGPLLGIRLLRLREDEHVLIVAMEHIISDGYSLNIVWRDLLAAYNQMLQGHDLSLPSIRVQFTDYALWQRNVQESRLEIHDAFWNEHLAGCQQLMFPEDRVSKTAAMSRWGTIRITIDKSLKADLRDWCRLRRTTLAMAVFTAYAALVLRWCNVSEGIFQYTIDARVNPDVENTIGFFAAMLYPRVKLLEEDSFIDLMNRITQEYCRVYEHADPHHLSAKVPSPEFTRTAAFNWLPKASLQIDHSQMDLSEEAIRCSPVTFVHPMMKILEIDGEPAIALFDREDGEITGEVSFPMTRFSVHTMERFGSNILVFIKALLRQPEGRVKHVVLV